MSSWPRVSSYTLEKWVCHPLFLIRIYGLPFPETQNNTGCISYFYFCCDQTSDKKPHEGGEICWARGLRKHFPHDGECASESRQLNLLTFSPLGEISQSRQGAGQSSTFLDPPLQWPLPPVGLHILRATQSPKTPPPAEKHSFQTYMSVGAISHPNLM